jgi:hypothetical protein
MQNAAPLTEKYVLSRRKESVAQIRDRTIGAQELHGPGLVIAVSPSSGSALP